MSISMKSRAEPKTQRRKQGISPSIIDFLLQEITLGIVETLNGTLGT